MRVLEPQHFNQHKKRPKRRPVRLIVACLLLLAVAGGGYYYFQIHLQSQKVVTPPPKRPVVASPLQTKPADQLKPKEFTGNQFKNLYRSVIETYPNTEAFLPPPAITSDTEADVRIRALAEARGFRLTRIPVTALVKTNEPRLKDQTDDLLQPAAFAAWQSLKAAAQKDNVPLALNSAYRSPEWQRDLFMERLLSRGVTTQQVIDGQADAAINATFTVTAVPGYSRHHTGYTVDFWCEDGIGNFGTSICFKWLNDNNYLHAKEHGWIPSYPPDADEQGPEPEPWEYVWVGRDLLFE